MSKYIIQLNTGRMLESISGQKKPEIDESHEREAIKIDLLFFFISFYEYGKTILTDKRKR